MQKRSQRYPVQQPGLSTLARTTGQDPVRSHKTKIKPDGMTDWLRYGTLHKHRLHPGVDLPARKRFARQQPRSSPLSGMHASSSFSGIRVVTHSVRSTILT